MSGYRLAFQAKLDLHEIADYIAERKARCIAEQV